MEVDAYAFSTIASYCSTGLGNLVSEDPSTAPIAALNRAFTYFANKEVPVQDQIAFVSPDFMNALRNSNEVTKFLGQTDYSRNDITFQITKYQGRDLVEVSPERLRTDIKLFGQEGYSWDSTKSKAINFLMVAKSAVTHVVKYNTVKVIGDDLNLAGQGFDGYTIFARVYHDVFVPDNKRVALYCSVASTAGNAPAMTLDVVLKDGKIKSITTYPGEKLAFVCTSSDTSVTVGKTLSNVTLVHVGDALATGTKVYAINSDKVVLAIATA